MCAGTTWIPSRDGRPGVERCECQKRKITAARIAEVLSGWPEYAKASLESYSARSIGQENAFRSIAENPTGSYFLFGSFSRGKTHLMIAQYRYMAMRGSKCLLRSARELMEELRKAEVAPDTGHEPAESPVLKMINVANSGHLFIDDIDKAPARSSFRVETLFDLFDTIKRRQIGLTVTSNLPLWRKKEEKFKDPKKPLQDLRDLLTEQVVSRLYAVCRPIEI